MIYREAIKAAEKQLAAAGINTHDATLLMMELSDQKVHNLYLEYDQPVEEALLIDYQAKIIRLTTNEPLAQILGYEYFYGYRFLVNQDVLIPRPETEELVANVLAAYDEYYKGQKINLIDVGCGSGAIGITLKKEEPNLQIKASDISADAVKVAKENARALAADVEFLVGDMLNPFIDLGLKVDILVSNPPYIPSVETMESSVVDFEPHVALFGGTDGLKFYRLIFEKANQILKPQSILAFEMGYDQKENLTKLAREYFKSAKIEVLKDINGKNRMLFIYNR